MVDGYLARITRPRVPLPLATLRGLAGDGATAGAGPLEIAAALIAKAQRIVVLVGAGISVSCGIPDFRSPGTGLYDVIRAARIQGLNEAEEM